MPRGKTNNYALAEDATGNLVPVPRAAGPLAIAPSPDPLEVNSRLNDAGEAFLAILAREDGWLRVVGGLSQKQTYWKFKFNNGQHKGFYVMYVGAASDWTRGILGLAEKLEEVDRGVRKPAYDTFYDPR